MTTRKRGILPFCQRTLTCLPTSAEVDTLRAMDDAKLREHAIKRLKKKADYWRLWGTFLVISAILVLVWGFTSDWHGYFWPMWPFFGFALALIFGAIDTFGPKNYINNEAKIQAEIRKMSGGSAGQ